MDFIEDEIVEIVEIGQMDLLDIAVSHDHLFLANGILTHNSAIAAQGEFDHSHIAGGISKINTADNVIAIWAPNLEHGEYQMLFLKTRTASAVGQRIRMHYDVDCMRITDGGAMPNERARSMADIKETLKAANETSFSDIATMMNTERKK